LNFFIFYFLFIYFLKDDGSVFSFGYNGGGSLGFGSTTNQSYLQKIKFENEKIDKIFSSFNCNGCFFYSSLFFLILI
jgi:hypothetical protein